EPYRSAHNGSKSEQDKRDGIRIGYSPARRISALDILLFFDIGKVVRGKRFLDRFLTCRRSHARPASLAGRWFIGNVVKLLFISQLIIVMKIAVISAVIIRSRFQTCHPLP